MVLLPLIGVAEHGVQHDKNVRMAAASVIFSALSAPTTGLVEGLRDLERAPPMIRCRAHRRCFWVAGRPCCSGHRDYSGMAPLLSWRR
jgi:hypothetical protein